MDDDAKPKEIALLGPPSPDGSVPAVRIGEDGVRVGVLRPADPGSDLAGREVLDLQRVGDGPAYEVTVIHNGRSGPAMVNSREFRSGWDGVFGKRDGSSALN